MQIPRFALHHAVQGFARNDSQGTFFKERLEIELESRAGRAKSWL
jgi:hypothetical protein